MAAVAKRSAREEDFGGEAEMLSDGHLTREVDIIDAKIKDVSRTLKRAIQVVRNSSQISEGKK